MKSFFNYLFSIYRQLTAVIISDAVIFLTLWLSKVPVKTLIYPLLLSLFLVFLFTFFEFFRTRNQTKKISCLTKLPAELLTTLPKAETAQEEAYQQIVLSLKEEVQAVQEASFTIQKEAIDYFSVWVHQIKTPIASMHLWLENEDTPLARHLLSELLKIEQYVSMVLAYLRLESDSTDFLFRSYDLDSIIKHSIIKFSGDFIQKGLCLNYKPCSFKLVTDEKWFTFVIEQVLSNALKYTQNGEIAIYFQEPGHLVIKDTGIGIAPEDLPRIFEKGYTGINGHLSQKSSGLGLYLCHRICDDLGLNIQAESEPGKGTSIIIAMEQDPLKVE